jgi:di/tricarboxylate transporter
MFGMVALTFAATCFVPTAALVVLMAPIVLNTSRRHGPVAPWVNDGGGHGRLGQFDHPHCTPGQSSGHGTGGYRFLDYFKIGGLLTLVITALLMLLMPVLWPLVP